MNWESLNRNYRFIEILTVACFVFVSSAAEEKNQDYSPSGGEWERVSDTSYEHKGSIFSGFRYSTDNDATNTYNYEVGSPFSPDLVNSPPIDKTKLTGSFTALLIFFIPE